MSKKDPVAPMGTNPALVPLKPGKPIPAAKPKPILPRPKPGKK